MSYDLYFCSSKPTEFRFDEVVAWSRQYASFKQTTESQLFYENEHTGTYFSLDYAAPADRNDLDIPPGVFDTGLSFNLNYARPTFFALESMPIIEALAKHFGLKMFDPQHEPSVGTFSSDQLLASWSSSNQSAVETLGQEHDVTFFYLASDRSMEFWRYMTAYSRLNSELDGADVFVPRQCLMSLQKSKRAETAFVWAQGTHLVIPRTDWIVVMFPKGLLRREHKMRCFRSDTVMVPMAQYLRDYDVGRGIRILPPENVTRADGVLKSLKGGLRREDVEFISSDKCVDVPFGQLDSN